MQDRLHNNRTEWLEIPIRQASFCSFPTLRDGLNLILSPEMQKRRNHRTEWHAPENQAGRAHGGAKHPSGYGAITQSANTAEAKRATNVWIVGATSSLISN